MLEFNVSVIMQCNVTLRDLEWEAARGSRPIQKLRLAANTALKHANALEMTSVSVFAERLLDRLKKRTITEEEYPTKHIEADIGNLRSRYVDELAGRMYLYMAPSRSAIWKDPFSGWNRTLEAFSQATTDIGEASYCYALSRGTATVFHLMRVMEIGVQALGDKFGVSDVTAKPWGSITNELAQKIKALPERTASEKLNKETLSEIWVHLDHVRLAWRNPTMHPKQTYTEAEAKDVYDRVRTFMNSFAAIAV